MNRRNSDKEANLLCWISLACLIVPLVLSPIGAKILLATSDTMVGGLFSFLNGVFSVLFTLARILGVVLMIYVRIKYPHNVFGIVLMWIYIIILVLIILFIIFIMVLCNGCMDGMSGCLTECRNIDS